MRYFEWLFGLFRGDFGVSYTYRVPVAELIVQRIGVSLPLAIYALTLTLLIAFPVGMVIWRAVEPGEWDCESRDDILQTLRERYEEGFTMGPIKLVEGGPGTVILLSRPAEVGGPEWPEETAIAITFRGGKVVAMQDHRTLADARRASNQA